MKVHIIRRLRTLATKTNGIIATVGVLIAILANAFELKNHIFGTTDAYANPILEELANEPSPEVDEVGKTGFEPSKDVNSKSTIVKKPESKDYFSQNEKLLAINDMALLIVNDKKRIDEDFSYEISNALSRNSFNPSTSFFTPNAIEKYASFYSASDSWLSFTGIKKILNAYLIGQLKTNKTNSSFDPEIKIIELKFTGKYINLKSNDVIAINEGSKISSYNQSKAMEEANKEIIAKIVSKLK